MSEQTNSVGGKSPFARRIRFSDCTGRHITVPGMVRRRDILRRWRSVRWPDERLYWNRRSNMRVNSHFEHGDIAIIRNGVLTVHFTKLSALIEYICEREEIGFLSDLPEADLDDAERYL
jgi:hypothetical protein